MFYEIGLKITKQDEKSGNDKEIKEQYLVKDVEFFAEAEAKGCELYNGEADIFSVKRSNVIEAINNKELEDDIFYKAKLSNIYTDDKGKEHENNYYILVAAKTMELAHKLVEDYMQANVLDLTFKSITETKILEII